MEDEQEFEVVIQAQQYEVAAPPAPEYQLIAPQQEFVISAMQ